VKPLEVVEEVQPEAPAALPAAPRADEELVFDLNRLLEGLEC
jgi:hypothetical protein